MIPACEVLYESVCPVPWDYQAALIVDHPSYSSSVNKYAASSHLDCLAMTAII